jgi:hypothetical protein
MKHFILIITLLYLFTFLAEGQNSKLTCTDIRNGIFYSYPKNTSGHYISYMTNEYEKDINVETGDTMLWKIDAINDCSSKESLISTNDRNMSEATRKGWMHHKLVSKVLTITDAYFVYADYIDKDNGRPFAVDTAWFQEKVNYTNTGLYQMVTDSSFITDTHFTDTSKYALLYIYRPGKGLLILGTYPVFCNDNAICIMKNKTGYIFKILREGNLTIKSVLYKDSASTQFNVKFGNCYYAKASVDFGIYRVFDNYKLRMSSIEADEGKKEFEEVDFQNDFHRTKINKIMKTVF